MIRRTHYMDQLKDFACSDLVKIITGVRRSGKSTLLKQLKNDLIEEGVDPTSIISVDFELPSHNELTDPRCFIEFVAERIPDNKPTFLFVDEVQELANWEQTINGLRAEYNLNIYITGSNARMLSGENATYLSGRYVSIHALPLSLAELCQFTDVDIAHRVSVENAYTQLVSDGGFPAVTLASTSALKTAMLDGIYDSVFMRDVLLRGNIRNEAAFLRVASFLFDNIGNQTSASSIAKSLNVGGHKINPETIDNYLRLMQNAHLIYRCERFDIRRKERLRTNGKYYVVDMGLQQRIVGLRESNRGHITENLVYLELLRRKFDVAVGVLPNAEIDFVVNRGKEFFYIQVCESALDPETLQRELAPFEKLTDSYPCILITKDREDLGYKGVRHINLYDFLLGEKL